MINLGYFLLSQYHFINLISTGYQFNINTNVVIVTFTDICRIGRAFWNKAALISSVEMPNVIPQLYMIISFHLAAW